MYGVLNAFTLSGSFAVSGTPAPSQSLNLLLYTDTYPASYTIDGTGLDATYTGILSSAASTIPVVLSAGEGYKYIYVDISTDYASWTGMTGFLVHDFIPTLQINVVSGYTHYNTSFTLSGILSDAYYLSGLYINNVSYTGCNFA